MDDRDDQFYRRELQVRRLCREDPRFAGIWEDYAEILAVLRRLRAQAAPPSEVLCDCTRLQEELAAEILSHLDARFPRRNAGD